MARCPLGPVTRGRVGEAALGPDFPFFFFGGNEGTAFAATERTGKAATAWTGSEVEALGELSGGRLCPRGTESMGGAVP